MILGIDAGLANLGYSFLCIMDNKKVVVGFGVITTEKNKKSKVKDDNILRIRNQCNELFSVINEIQKRYKVCAMCIESYSQPRGASSAVKYAFSYSMAISIAMLYKIPVFDCPPKKIKKICTGNPSAKKEDIIYFVDKMFGPLEWPKGKSGRTLKSVMEHPADSLACTYSLLNKKELVGIYSKVLNSL